MAFGMQPITAVAQTCFGVANSQPAMWPPKKKTGTTLCLFGSHQYSDGRSSVVALRSASVIIQSLVPFERVYAESSRKP
jgi:hypothetical protein